MLNKSKIALLWVAVLLSLAVLLMFPTDCRNGATNGVFLCLQVLVPSLFPFMILSSFVASSGIIQKVPKVIGSAIKFLFGLPPCAFAPIFLSLIGGYPVGATSIKELYRQGHLTKEQSERMAMFCVSAGPGFLITYIGAVMTRNLKLGYLLLISQIISLFMLGIIAKFWVIPLNEDNTETINYCKKRNSIKDSVIYSIENAIKATSSMCALVVVFSAVSEVFITLCNNNPAIIWLTALIEITNGTKVLADAYPVVLLAFVCGFGGLCVHFQIFVQLKDLKINKCNFYIFRFLQGLLCAIFSGILIKLFPLTKTVFSTINEVKPEFYTTSIGCVFLILVCAAFIVCTRQRRI